MVSTPSVPSAKDTAAAQTATNVDTAIANAGLSHTNQVTPEGSLSYDVTGHTTMKDQNGKEYDLPTYTATQTLSDSNQRIYDTNQQTKEGLAGIGLSQTGKIGDLLGSNIDLSSGNIDKYSNDHWKGGFDRTWNQKQQELEASLASKGIQPGSEAYRNAMGDFTYQRQNAEDQNLGNMYGNSVSAISQERNQPINEISALLSGSQISNPNYVSTPTTQMPTVDYAGLINNEYQQQSSASNASMGGLFGLAGTLGSAALKYGGGAALFSDRRLKTDIRRVGTHPLGIGLYRYRYTFGGGEHVGVMADEVRRVMPTAVARGAGGFDMVDYSMIGGA